VDERAKAKAALTELFTEGKNGQTPVVVERIVDPNMGPRLVSFFFSRGLTPPLTFLVSIGTSFVSSRAALLTWFLMLVIRPVLSRMHSPADSSTPWWRRVLER